VLILVNAAFKRIRIMSSSRQLPTLPQAASHHLPLICFVNKMDRSGADAQRAVHSMQVDTHK
jgi:translation elongation factor EF-G